MLRSAHKITVFAAIDGLVLQPVRQQNQRIPPSLLIKYSTGEIVSLEPGSYFDVASSDVFEIYGVVGIFAAVSVSYIILISQRQQVAQVENAPIYVVTGVACIPLTSQASARTAIVRSFENLKEELNVKVRTNQSLDDSDTSDIDADHEDSMLQDELISSPDSPRDSASIKSAVSSKASTSVAKDVMSRKGEYGRFTDKWFSNRGWSIERMKNLGTNASEKDNQANTTKSCKEIAEREDEAITRSNSASYKLALNLDKIPFLKNVSDSRQQDTQPGGEEHSSKQGAASKLLPKLLRTIKLLLCSHSFFFSYGYDISRRHGSLENAKLNVPSHESVDPIFFWNYFLSKSLIDGGHHAYVLPLIQGFVGQRTFTIKPVSQTPSDKSLELQEDNIHHSNHTLPDRSDDKFLITLISRRFITRPGLRYLRRGIDDEGYTANSVETEQLLSKQSGAPLNKMHSFTQIRGSIPLYFSQSPYSFKPVPNLQHSYEKNHIAFRRHLKILAARYGALQIVSLVDRTGGEAEIGEQYELHTKHLNDEKGIGGAKVGFEYFDFHEKCRGFRYANIRLLTDSLRDTLDSFNTTVVVDGIIQEKQNGILRTNCMDCLDRTNIAQSAFAQIILQKQLKEEGVEVDLQVDTSTEWFNILWANNGDALSKQYSSTAALKGDYTRTRKRNYRGAISDFGLTLSRYFHNIFNDYFSQAVIDFLTGNVTSQVFEEFELNMMSRDPGISIEKLRFNAIDTSAGIAIEDPDEDLIEGWILLSPQQHNTIRTFPLEETVLLLTKVALYAVRFDWNMEKVSSFERVELRSLTGITQGTYITSILTSTQTDEEKNVGLVIKYYPTKANISRTNTRSLNTAPSQTQSPNPPLPTQKNPFTALALAHHAFENLLPLPSNNPPTPALKILAFKVLPSQSSLNLQTPPHYRPSEKAVVKKVCAVIENAVIAELEREKKKKGDSPPPSPSNPTTPTTLIEYADIISLEEARRSTGLWEQWGHELKKLVWA